MLTHLHIKDFVLVDELELDCFSGLSVMTGETGAGKSILLDALSLATGAKASAGKVRQGASKAEISAYFDIASLELVKKWLADAEMQDDGESECVLRRVITAEGRSRSFINGRSATLGQLSELGAMLVDIHSQHAHQALLKPVNHTPLFDAYAGTTELALQTAQCWQQWNAAHKALEQARSTSAEANAQFQLLSYQVEELEKLAPLDGEVESLEAQQKSLSSRDQIVQSAQLASSILSDEEQGIIGQTQLAAKQLEKLPQLSEQLRSALQLLREAQINMEEASNELEAELDQPDDHQAKLQQVEARLSELYEVARKHRITAQELATYHQQLNVQLSELNSGDEQIALLEKELHEKHENYSLRATELTRLRNTAAPQLAEKINSKLKALAMPHSWFEARFNKEDTPSLYGNEKIEFLISTAPGREAQALRKVASGGELSRISLAIQVITAQCSTIPTLIFDEVDVGIGGTTGDEVGRLLRELGQKAQVMCVTHLAQVASKAKQHFRVDKVQNKKSLISQLSLLNETEKVAEISRMMGGDITSNHALAHAKQMLELH